MSVNNGAARPQKTIAMLGKTLESAIIEHGEAGGIVHLMTRRNFLGTAIAGGATVLAGGTDGHDLARVDA